MINLSTAEAVLRHTSFLSASLRFSTKINLSTAEAVLRRYSPPEEVFTILQINLSTAEAVLRQLHQSQMTKPKHKGSTCLLRKRY